MFPRLRTTISSSRNHVTSRIGRKFRPLRLEELEPRRLLAVDFELLVDLDARTRSSAPVNFATTGTNEEVLFFADDGIHGREPWLTDGTEAGTRMLADLVPGEGSSGPLAEAIPLGESFVFPANGELWRVDAGGSEPVSLLNDVVTPQYQTAYVSVGGSILFVGSDSTLGSSPSRGTELWRTSGVPGDATLVRDITPDGSHSSIENFQVVGDRLFFLEDNRKEVWVTDGTEAGTQLVLGLPRSFNNSSEWFISYQEDLIVRSDDRLWRIDGETLATNLFYESPGSEGNVHAKVAVAKGRVYFVSQNQLWVSDATLAGTSSIAELSTPDDRLSNAAFSETSFGVLLNARFRNGGEQTWVSNGNPEATAQLPAYVVNFSDPAVTLGEIDYLYGSRDLPWFARRPMAYRRNLERYRICYSDTKLRISLPSCCEQPSVFS